MSDNPYGSKTIEEATNEAVDYIKKRRSGEIISFCNSLSKVSFPSNCGNVNKNVIEFHSIGLFFNGTLS